MTAHAEILPAADEALAGKARHVTTRERQQPNTQHMSPGTAAENIHSLRDDVDRQRGNLRLAHELNAQEAAYAQTAIDKHA